MQLEIIYEDKEIIVCKKPAGVATQTKRIGQQDMESLLKNYRVRKGEEAFIGVVHRLDQPVQGIMVFGKNANATANLSAQVRNRTIGKYYYAMCCGILPSEGVLEDYILADKKNNTSSIVSSNTPGAQLAKLEAKRIEKRGEFGIYDIKLHTGRHHQIRLQFASRGCPLVGDRKYGKSLENPFAQGLLLCSYRLEFEHPGTKKKMDFSMEPDFLNARL